jgi:hypothetical protein|tara:strand:+ start:1173 stop:1382 length:210 start_codon:yes stop_codon:yes gene_type:complete
MTLADAVTILLDGAPVTYPRGANALVEEPNWVRRPEAAARTEVRRTATLGAAVARTVGTVSMAAIVCDL